MFGLGFWELVVIAVVALLFVGPDRLPRLFRALGRATREFQRASRELRENLSLDEPPPRRPVHRPPPVDVRVEPVPGGKKPPSRGVERPDALADEWPTAPPIAAESKPSEPFGAPASPQLTIPGTARPDEFVAEHGEAGAGPGKIEPAGKPPVFVPSLPPPPPSPKTAATTTTGTPGGKAGGGTP